MECWDSWLHLLPPTTTEWSRSDERVLPGDDLDGGRHEDSQRAENVNKEKNGTHGACTSM
jgi:hypothetical protein